MTQLPYLGAALGDRLLTLQCRITCRPIAATQICKSAPTRCHRQSFRTDLRIRRSSSEPTMAEARRFRNSRAFGTRGAESGRDPVMTTTSSARLAVVNAWLRNRFRSMRRYNYRVWAAGTIVSNTGTWMQRIAQDWLVLTQLTQHSGTSVGIVMSLQFGPPIVLMPLAGMLADRVDRRSVLLATQSAMAATALGLGLLVITGRVTLWHVYLFAGLMG